MISTHLFPSNIPELYQLETLHQTWEVVNIFLFEIAVQFITHQFVPVYGLYLLLFTHYYYFCHIGGQVNFPAKPPGRICNSAHTSQLSRIFKVLSENC